MNQGYANLALDVAHSGQIAEALSSFEFWLGQLWIKPAVVISVNAPTVLSLMSIHGHNDMTNVLSHNFLPSWVAFMQTQFSCT